MLTRRGGGALRHPPMRSLLEEEVIRGVRDEGLFADVLRRVTACRRRKAADGIQPLDERRPGERIAAERSGLTSNTLQQQPRNRTLVDEVRVRRRRVHF